MLTILYWAGILLATTSLFLLLPLPCIQQFCNKYASFVRAIPPVVVASYIFVFGWKREGAGIKGIIWDSFVASAMVWAFFFVFTLCLLVLVSLSQRIGNSVK